MQKRKPDLTALNHAVYPVASPASSGLKSETTGMMGLYGRDNSPATARRGLLSRLWSRKES